MRMTEREHRESLDRIRHSDPLGWAMIRAGDFVGKLLLWVIAILVLIGCSTLGYQCGYWLYRLVR